MSADTNGLAMKRLAGIRDRTTDEGDRIALDIAIGSLYFDQQEQDATPPASSPTAPEEQKL